MNHLFAVTSGFKILLPKTIKKREDYIICGLLTPTRSVVPSLSVYFMFRLFFTF